MSIECEFARPSRLGDRLGFELVVERMGEGSFTLKIVANDRNGEQRMKARLVLACIDLETGRARRYRNRSAPAWSSSNCARQGSAETSRSCADEWKERDEDTAAAGLGGAKGVR